MYMWWSCMVHVGKIIPMRWVFRKSVFFSLLWGFPACMIVIFVWNTPLDEWSEVSRSSVSLEPSKNGSWDQKIRRKPIGSMHDIISTYTFTIKTHNFHVGKHTLPIPLRVRENIHPLMVPFFSGHPHKLLKNHYIQLPKCLVFPRCLTRKKDLQ